MKRSTLISQLSYLQGQVKPPWWDCPLNPATSRAKNEKRMRSDSHRVYEELRSSKEQIHHLVITVGYIHFFLSWLTFRICKSLCHQTVGFLFLVVSILYLHMIQVLRWQSMCHFWTLRVKQDVLRAPSFPIYAPWPWCNISRLSLLGPLGRSNIQNLPQICLQNTQALCGVEIIGLDLTIPYQHSSELISCVGKWRSKCFIGVFRWVAATPH